MTEALVTPIAWKQARRQGSTHARNGRRPSVCKRSGGLALERLEGG